MNWTTEDLFIEKVIISDGIPNLDHAVLYIIDPINNAKHKEEYESWIKIRDEIICEFKPGKEIKVYAYNGYVAEGIIKEDELEQLKKKISDDELSILKQTHKIAMNEAIHAEDELWYDR